MILTSIPIVGNFVSIPVSASMPASMSKLTKEDDPYYDPTFIWDEDAYNDIISQSSSLHDFGRLPNFEEFKALTGYTGLNQISLTDFRNTYGVGNVFSAPSDSVCIAICNPSELDLLSSLVNNTAENETAVEQAYYSTGDYTLGSDIRYTGTKFMPIGSDVYPFNGHFDGGTFAFRNIQMIQEASSDYENIGYFGLFGYIGNDGVVENLGIIGMKITMPYAVNADAGFLCGRNYGTIRQCYVNGKRTSIMSISNATAGGISAENYGSIFQCYADAWIDVDVESGSYSEPQPFATVNNGTVSECYYIQHGVCSYYVKTLTSRESTADDNTDATFVGWKYLGDTSQIAGIGLPVNEFLHLSEKLNMFSNGATRVVSGVYSDGYKKKLICRPAELEYAVGRGDYFNTQYSFLTSFDVYISNQEDRDIYDQHINQTIPQSDAEYNFWRKANAVTRWSNTISYDYKRIFIDFYPALGVPDKDADGVYLIRNVANFMWLLQYTRNNERARLMNTIDLSNIFLDYIPSGSFTLDGTLTDTNDICNLIDIDAITKCYGLLNLNIKNAKLANNVGAFSNIYFIGGNFTINDREFVYDHGGQYDTSAVYIARSFDNVHTSMTITWGGLTQNTYVDKTIRMAETAVNSSISGEYIILGNNADRNGYFSPLADTCTDCSIYTKFVIQRNIKGWFTGSGKKTTRCISHTSIDTRGNNITAIDAALYSLGSTSYDSIAPDTYDCHNTPTLYPLGNSSYDCTFSGHYIGRQTADNIALANYAKNLAITESAVIDGVTESFCKSTSLNVFFRGTWNTYIQKYVSQSMFKLVYNGVSYGKINIRPVMSELSNTTNSTYLKMGLTKESSYYNNSSTSINFFGSGTGIFYSDVSLIDCDGIAFPKLALTVQNLYINQFDSEHQYNKYTTIKQLKDIRFDGNYFIDRLTVLSGGWTDIQMQQYGNIFVGDNAYFSSISFTNVSSCKNYLVNYGNAEIRNGSSLSFRVFNSNYQSEPYINYGNVLLEKSKNDSVAAFYDICITPYLSVTSNNINYNIQNINYGDLTLNYKNGIEDVPRNVNVTGCYGVQVGDITISNLKTTTSLSVIVCGVANYGDVDIHDIKSGYFYYYGCDAVTSSNVDIDAYMFGSTHIKNVVCTHMEFMNFRYHTRKGYQNSSKTDFFHTDANVVLENITCTADYSKYSDTHISTGLGGIYNDDANYYTNIYDFSGNSQGSSYLAKNRVLNIDVGGSLTVKNFNTKNIITFDGCVFFTAESGYKHNYADVLFDGVTAKSINYSGISDNHTTTQHSEWVNASNITFRNVVISATSIICGISSLRDEYEADTPYCVPFNAYNLGSMDLEINGASVIVAGISRSIRTNIQNVKNSIVVNNSEIKVKCDHDIDIVGIQYTPSNYSDSMIMNAINDGSIEAIQTGSGSVNVDGITNSCKTIRSVENMANIKVTCPDSTAGHVATITGNSSDCAGWVNYGSVDCDNISNINCITAQNADALIQYGINYGELHSEGSNNEANTICIVDLSNNLKSVPSGLGTFSNDASAQGDSISAVLSINDFDTIAGREEPPTSDRMHSKKIVYTDILLPEFGFRYDNEVTPSYITEQEKDVYNEGNIFEYAEADELRGILSDTVNDNFGQYGGMTLMGSRLGKYDSTLKVVDIDPLIGVNLESILYKNRIVDSTNEYSWWNDFEVDDGVTFKNYIVNRLKQRNIGTYYELYEANIESVDEYETVNGTTSVIQNKSSLLRFQGSIDGNDDGIFSNDTTVSIIDEYIISNDFVDIIGKDIDWKVTNVGVYNSDGSVCIYEEPIRASSDSEFKQAIKTFLADESYKGDDLALADSVSLTVPDLDETIYAIIGYVPSEDGRKTNIIAMRLHSVTTDPLGWITSLTYPTDYDIDTSKYVITDAFSGSVSYYDDTKGYTPLEHDKTTVEKIEVDNHAHPKYTITQPMFHTSDEYRVSLLDWGETPTVNLNFRVQNVSEYTIQLDGNGKSFYYTENIENQDGVSSPDGTVIIKTISKDLTSEDFKTQDDVVLSKKYTQNNPFLTGEIKTITVTGKNSNGDVFTLFTADLPKNKSYENYIKSSDVSRNNLKTHNQSLINNFSNQPIDLAKIERSIFVLYNKSTLSSKSDYTVETTDWHNHGDYTYYPSHVYNKVKVTAENNDVVEYVRHDKIVDFDYLGISYFTVLSNATGYGHSIVLNDGSTQCSARINTNPSQLTSFSATDVLMPDGSKKAFSFVLDKVEVYVDGVYDHDMILSDNQRTANDDLYGMVLSLSSYSYLNYFLTGNVLLADIPDEPITFKTFVKYETTNGDVIKLQLEDFSFSKSLDSHRTLISSDLKRAISTTVVSDVADNLSDNMDVNADGLIVYQVNSDTIGHIYIDDVVEPNCTTSSVEYHFSEFATLQYFDGSVWKNVSSTNGIYKTNYTFTFNGLGTGYSYEYRILAQDYNTTNHADHVTYFTHRISAVTRNKKLSIEFDTSDAMTMVLYNQIIQEHDNLSIQVKNMNRDQISLQQTKIYQNDSSLESTYYNISQGDFAILLGIPSNYTYSVRIVGGGSSEGILQDHPTVKGKRFRLPYANAQTIRLLVTLEYHPQNNWGVVYEKNLLHSERHNLI